MKRGRFTETQIVSILKEADVGGKVKDICRHHGIVMPRITTGSRNTEACRRQI